MQINVENEQYEKAIIDMPVVPRNGDTIVLAGQKGFDGYAWSVERVEWFCAKSESDILNCYGATLYVKRKRYDNTEDIHREVVE
jgi:hypothetical protein